MKGIFLLFDSGTRPGREALRKFVDSNRFTSLTHDPARKPSLHVVGAQDAQSSVADASDETLKQPFQWLELLRDGLTFDLEGLAPGEGVSIPRAEHFFDIKSETIGPGTEALRLAAGMHLSGAEGSLPVIRGMMGLARDLVKHFEHIKAVVWPPSASAIGRRFFESTATAWLEGGAFPALGLTAFRKTIDGGLQSVGLDFLIGQELRIEPGLAADEVAATRLGVRLINQLVHTGRVESREEVIGPQGDRLQLEPSVNGKFIRLWNT